MLSTVYSLQSTQSPLLVIVGETASGKSSLALSLAQRFDGEIIAADSWTVYKGFDIGTAKPSTQERQRIPHHLVDVVEPQDGFNAALYQRLALQAITDIQTRGKLPILVGGTGLYIDSVLFDFGFLPTVDAGQRAYRNEKSLEQLLLEARKGGIDMTGIDLRNKRRVIRALETDGQRPKRASLRPNTLVVGIAVPRETLRGRITERIESMLEQGLEREVAGLVDRYGWEVEPMKGIGYREWHEYFLGTQNLEQTKERIISATMNLAKRQRTWFKRNNSIRWFNYPSEVVDLATTFLNKKQ